MWACIERGEEGSASLCPRLEPRAAGPRAGAQKKSGLPPFYASGPVQGQSGSARAAAMRSSVTGSK